MFAVNFADTVMSHLSAGWRTQDNSLFTCPEGTLLKMAALVGTYMKFINLTFKF